MSNRVQSLFFITVFLCLAAASGCSDDPSTPPLSAKLQVDLISPYHNECPDAPFVVHVESNRSLQRVEYRVDGHTVATTYQAPFEFLWNIALWADGGFHFLMAYGFDAQDDSHYDGNVGFRIPTGTDGVLLNPAPDSGVPDPTEATLRWRRDPQATEYEVVLSLQPDFSTISHTATSNDTTVTITVSEQQWQYWRMRAQRNDGFWGPWSESAAFYGGAVFSGEYVHNGSSSSIGYAVLQTENDGYLVAGGHNNYPLVRSFDSMGEPGWTFAPYFQGAYNDLVSTVDGGCVLVGRVQSDGSTNVILTQLDAHGQELWSHPYFGSDSSDQGWSILSCAEGGYVIAGRRDGSAWLFGVDDQGWLVWQNTYDIDQAFAVVERADGGFVFTGEIYSQFFVLVGTDSVGNEQWRTLLAGGDYPFGYSGIDLVADDFGYTALDESGQLHRFEESGQYQSSIYLGYEYYSALDKTADGGYIVASRSDLICLDESFQEVWRFSHDGTSTDIHQTSDGGFVVTGANHPPHSSNRLWLLKTNADGIFAPPAID